MTIKTDFQEGVFKKRSLAYAEQQGAYFNKIRSFNTKVANQVKLSFSFYQDPETAKIFHENLSMVEKYHGKYFKQSGGNKDELLNVD